MKAEDLLQALGEVQDEYIHDAKNHQKQKKSPWIKWGSAAAACLCLVALGAYFRGNIGGGAGGGGDADLTYMTYAGPVLPLTTLEESGVLQVQRSIDFDFSPYRDGDGQLTWAKSQANVTDRYLVTNSSAQDVTVTAMYPFAGSLGDVDHHAAVQVNGQTVQTTLYPGPYAGGYMGVWGANVEVGSANLCNPASFDDFEQLLSDGSYQASALDPFPVLDQPVVVYQLSDYVYTKDVDASNPTLNMEFYIDYEETQVLTYNFNGGANDPATGYVARHSGGIEVRPNASPKFREPEDAYLIILGEDIESYTLQGYRDGGCDEGEELDDLTCTVTRYETTLGEVICQLLDGREPVELRYGLVAELLLTDGPLGNTVDRYDDGMLEGIFSAAETNERVFYLAFELTVPAMGQIEVSGLTCKDGSMDYIGDDVGKEGYDLATRLGSTLSFTKQQATISNYDAIEIVNQNFGFDLENGLTQVELNLNQDHYWMEVKTRD